MKINLWQLNTSYDALTRLASQALPKEQHKLTYKLARVMKSAKGEIEDLSETLNELMKKCGFVRGQAAIDPQMANDYNRESKAFMKATEVEIWGDPIKLAEIQDHVSISPLDLADLSWLIVEEEQMTEAKGAAA